MPGGAIPALPAFPIPTLPWDPGSVLAPKVLRVLLAPRGISVLAKGPARSGGPHGLTPGLAQVLVGWLTPRGAQGDQEGLSCSWERCHPFLWTPGSLRTSLTDEPLGSWAILTLCQLPAAEGPSRRVLSFLSPSSVSRVEPECRDRAERRGCRCHHELSLTPAGLAGTGGRDEGRPQGPFRGCHTQHFNLLPPLPLSALVWKLQRSCLRGVPGVSLGPEP